MELAQAAKTVSVSSPAISYLIEYLEILESFDDVSIQFGKKAMIQALNYLKYKTDGLERYQVQEMIHRLKGSSSMHKPSHRQSKCHWSGWTICLLSSLSVCAVLSTILVVWPSRNVSSSASSPNFDSSLPIQKDPVEMVNDNLEVELWYDLDENESDSLQDVYSDEVFVDVTSTEVVWEEDSPHNDIMILISVLLAVCSGYGICKGY